MRYKRSAISPWSRAASPSGEPESTASFTWPTWMSGRNEEGNGWSSARYGRRSEPALVQDLRHASLDDSPIKTVSPQLPGYIARTDWTGALPALCKQPASGPENHERIIALADRPHPGLVL